MSDQSTGDEASFLPNWIQPFVENPGITIGALIAAVVIWFYIRGKVEGEIGVDAQLELNVKGEENKRYIITGIRRNAEEVRNLLNVRLNGPRSKLERIKTQDLLKISKTISVQNNTLDSPIQVNVREKNLELKGGRDFPFGVHMADTPIRLTVTVEEIVEETRTISGSDLDEEIARFTENEPASGYRIVDVVPQVDSVTIRGPSEIMSKAKIVPENKIDVSGQASNTTRRVNLTTEPASSHIKLSVESVMFTVQIASELTTKQIQKQFTIATGPKLSQYLKDRSWNFEPGNRQVSITFELPASIEGQLTSDNIHAILVLPEEEVEAIKNPTRPHTVSMDDFLKVIIDESIPNRERITVEEFKPDQIKFVPAKEES